MNVLITLYETDDPSRIVAQWVIPADGRPVMHTFTMPATANAQVASELEYTLMVQRLTAKL